MKEIFNTFKSNKEIKKKVFVILFIMILALQLFHFSKIGTIITNLDNVDVSFDKVKNNTSEVLIDNLLRTEMRRKGTGIKQSWLKYRQVHPEIDLLLKDDKDRIIYSNVNNESIAFDTKTMNLNKQKDGYTIIDKSTEKVLIEHSFPKWNKQNLSNLLGIITTNTQPLGPRGAVIIIDSLTGEILSESSKNLFNEEEKELSIYNLYKKNDNPLGITTNSGRLMMDLDTRFGDRIIKFYKEQYESEDKIVDNNFNKYPLGSSTRNFVETVHIPEETLGVDGTDMQLKIIVAFNEEDVSSLFSNVDEEFNYLNKSINTNIKLASGYASSSILINIFTILIAVFIIQITTSKKEYCEHKLADEKRLCNK